MSIGGRSYARHNISGPKYLRHLGSFWPCFCFFCSKYFPFCLNLDFVPATLFCQNDASRIFTHVHKCARISREGWGVKLILAMPVFSFQFLQPLFPLSILVVSRRSVCCIVRPDSLLLECYLVTIVNRVLLETIATNQNNKTIAQKARAEFPVQLFLFFSK